MLEPPTDIEVLDRALSALGDQAISLGQLDGLLAAVLVCPQPIPPEEWLTRLWVVEDEEDFSLETTEETSRAVAEILARHDRIASELERGGEAFGPLYDVDGRFDDVLWEIWTEGFEAGMSLRPDAWGPILAAKDEATQALSLLTTLIAIGSNDAETLAELAPETIKQLSTAAPDLLPECVQVLYDAQRPPGQPILKGPKVGRNDPCPCGSGKKFKKCCGAG